MKSKMLPKSHRSKNIGWLRAAVLGANDGIISTASLIIGVAAAHSTHENILIAAIAGLVAGAMSMASGEYVSVSSQADTENADLARERVELATSIDFEYKELAQIYEQRGLEPELAKKVAGQLMAHDAIGTHAREELGITDRAKPRPIQAAFSSAAAFSIGAFLPLCIVLVSPLTHLILNVSIASFIFLILLGILAACVGGANIWKGAFRVVFWGTLAMAVTHGVGTMLGASL